MQPIAKILVPLDFSEHSAAAQRFAVDLARRYEASLHLLHIYEPHYYTVPEGYTFPTPEVVTQLMLHLEPELQKSKQDALAAGARAVTTRLLEGYPASEIVRVAREGAFDLIVMGTHGRTGLKHLLIGSVAENVVRQAPCPVLTTRSTAAPSR